MIGQRGIENVIVIFHLNLIGFINLIRNRNRIGIRLQSSVYHPVPGSFFIPVICHIMPPGFRPRSGLHHFRHGQCILVIKNGLQHGLHLGRGVILIKHRKQCRQFKRIVGDLRKGIIVLIIPRMVCFDIVYGFLQIRFQLHIICLHLQNVRILRRKGSCNCGSVHSACHHGTGR